MRGGDGESQLEVDRRKVSERITRLLEELEQVRKQREVQRSGRKRNQWPLASIVGYTNAGKSTLLNALTGAEVTAEDKLFATLDPTTRRLRLPTNQNVLISDTVGFIRKLPHRLVEAFKATLEEVFEFMMTLRRNAYFEKGCIVFITAFLHLPYLIEARHDLGFFERNPEFQECANGFELASEFCQEGLESFMRMR